MPVKIESFSPAPKRKYVRKVKVEDLEKEKDILCEDMEKMKITRVRFEEKKKVEKKVDKRLQGDVWKLFQDVSNRLISHLPIQSLDASTLFDTPQNVYLYLSVEEIGKNVEKHVFFTHLHNPLPGHIILPTYEPPNHTNYHSVSEEVYRLHPMVQLHVKKFYLRKTECNMPLSGNVLSSTYEVCEKRSKRKMDETEECDWNFDFCQIKLLGLSNMIQNKYAFEKDGKYYSFTYANE
jgi:hypothetical protein